MYGGVENGKDRRWVEIGIIIKIVKIVLIKY